jgi:polyferredoxin
MKPRRDWVPIARLATQAGFVIFVLVVALRAHLSSVATPSLHAYCPFGVIASLGTLITTGALVPKLHFSTVVLGGGVLLSGLLVGGAFCGWICPLGALGDALLWLRRKLRLPELRVPLRVDRVLRYGRFVVLLAVMGVTFRSVALVFANIDPYYTIFSLDWLFEPNLVEHWPAYAFAVALIGGSLFVPRLWCRYLCPLGGLLTVLQRLSPIKVRRNTQTCIDCKRCDRVCPTRVAISTVPSVTHDCTMCLRCVSACPVKATLETRLPGATADEKSREERAA